MQRDMIIRAWKDPEFRASLSTQERSTLPECPAGRSLTELGPEELAGVTGGYSDLVTRHLDPNTNTYHLICRGLELTPIYHHIDPGDPGEREISQLALTQVAYGR